MKLFLNKKNRAHICDMLNKFFKSNYFYEYHDFTVNKADKLFVQIEKVDISYANDKIVISFYNNSIVYLIIYIPFGTKFEFKGTTVKITRHDKTTQAYSFRRLYFSDKYKLKYFISSDMEIEYK